MPTPGSFPTLKRRTSGACVAALMAASITVSHSLAGDPHASSAAPVADTVILQLPKGGERTGDLAALWRDLQRAPGSADAAVRYAGEALQRYAVTGDARYIGYAQGALAPWQQDADPPLQVWLLRGRILQTQHRFAEAGAYLDRLLARHRDSAEGMLLSADAWRRAGDIARAKARCAGLALAGFSSLALHCAGDILLSLGEAGKAYALLAPLHAEPGRGQPQLQQWMLTVAADAAAADRKVAEALALYERALAIPGATIAMHASYADLLLAEERPSDALAALARAQEPDADALLLRRAIAARELGRADAHALRKRLRTGFVEAEKLGTAALHWREQALFALLLANDPNAALTYAGKNWRQQKGPEDAALFIQAARASGRPEAANAVYEWRQSQQFGDV